MKGLGNYRELPAAPQIERQHGTVVAYQGPRATVAIRGGQVYSMMSEPLRKAGVVEGGPFVMSTTRVAGRIVEVKVQAPTEARPPMPRRGTPKVYLKDGQRMSTRK